MSIYFDMWLILILFYTTQYTHDYSTNIVIFISFNILYNLYIVSYILLINIMIPHI